MIGIINNHEPILNLTKTHSLRSEQGLVVWKGLLAACIRENNRARGRKVANISLHWYEIKTSEDLYNEKYVHSMIQKSQREEKYILSMDKIPTSLVLATFNGLNG